MCEDFKAAIRQRCCLLFARAERLSNPFTLVAPDVFDQLEVIDWAKGEGRGPAGERFYSLHAVPPEFAREITISEQIRHGEQPLNAARKVRIAPKQQPALEALTALRANGVDLDSLTPKEKTKKVADYLKQQGRPKWDIPSSRTVERAAAVEQAQHVERRTRR
jgi:hypothetical protein